MDDVIIKILDYEMLGLWFDNDLRLRDDVPNPSVGNECVIRISLAGFCSTDKEIVKGYMAFSGVIGHEFVGIVEKSPNKHLVGKRMVGEINCFCGKCVLCKTGLTNHCTNRTVLGIFLRNGVIAEKTSLPEINLHEVPDDIPDEKAVFVEPLAASLEIFEQSNIESDVPLVVIGDGKLGLLSALAYSALGHPTTLIGKHKEKMAIAERVGVKCAFVGEAKPMSEAIIIEASGSPSGLEEALRVIVPMGSVFLKSTYAESAMVNLAPFVINEIAIIGSRCGPFDKALELLESGKIDPSPLITAVYPLEKAISAYEESISHNALKVLVKPS